MSFVRTFEFVGSNDKKKPIHSDSLASFVLVYSVAVGIFLGINKSNASSQ